MELQQLHSRINPSLYKQIKQLASEKKISLNKIIESAISHYIRFEERQKLSKQFDKYISQTAESSDEFTTEFDHQTTQKLLDETEW